MSRKVYERSSKKASQPLNQHDSESTLYWIILILFSGLIFYSSFQTALFNGESNGVYIINSFESPIYNAILCSSILLSLGSIHIFRKWRPNDYIDLLVLYVWLIPLTFFISSFLSASQHLSIKMTLLQFMYATFFTLGIHLSRTRAGSEIIRYIIVFCGYAITLYGILNLLGLVYSRDAVMITGEELRLTSVFQYANAYAAFLIAILLSTIYLLLNTRSVWLILSYSFMLVPIVVSFFLTLSRGGMVVLPIIIILLLPFLNLKKQLLFMLYLAFPALLSLTIIEKVSSLGKEIAQKIGLSPSQILSLSDSLVSESIGYLAYATCVNTLLVTVFHIYISKRLLAKTIPWLEFKRSSLILPAIALLSSSMIIYTLLNGSKLYSILPKTLEQRIENINFQQHSVLERATFYKDAFKLIKDYPIFGSGGGGWAALYERYQNNPYTSRQVHNYFLQHWLEVGTLGLIVLVTFLFLVFFFYVRNFIRNKEIQKSNNNLFFYIVSMTLLVHSTIDFEMSYAFVSSLVFLCLGSMVATVSIGDLYFIKKKITLLNKVKLMYPLMLLTLSALVTIYTFMQISSNRYYSASLYNAQSQKPLQEVMTPLNKAIQITPYHVGYVSTKVGFLTQLYTQSTKEEYYNEALELLLKMKNKEENNKILFQQELDLYILKNEQEKILTLLQEGLKKFPWDAALYERYANLNFMLYTQARATNESLANYYGETIINTYNTVLQKVEHLKGLPETQEQGAPFSMQLSLVIVAGKVHLFQGNYSMAENLFKGYINGSIDNPEVQEIVRTYLVAVMKQGKTDQALYDKLVSKNGHEKEEIEMLLRSVP